MATNIISSVLLVPGCPATGVVCAHEMSLRMGLRMGSPRAGSVIGSFNLERASALLFLDPGQEDNVKLKRVKNSGHLASLE